MKTTPTTNVGVVLGTMAIGEAGQGSVHVSTQEATIELLDAFQKHGHDEVDTARIYAGGTTEEFLAAAGYQERGLRMETKSYPTKGRNMEWLTAEQITHSPAELRQSVNDSLAALKTDKFYMFYLHGPDRTVPFEDTLREVNKMHTEGIFERFGLSNFQSWEVAKICEICKRNGWVLPTVYQGLYNAQQRIIEAELVPCLRHYGISLYVFNPLAGGFLTSRYSREAALSGGERFDPASGAGKLYRMRYWNEPSFKALDLLRPVIARHGITESQAALRWLAHHSALKKEFGDAVVVGASSVKHLEENLVALEAGPLPEDVVEALDAGWAETRALPSKYWH
ncbi:NADP-dependent oxidoreductase domain-containing protein [Mycena filopes]|nr:NADP-dependent oxidoreductase domain-containing protein [Mycena filopes]